MRSILAVGVLIVALRAHAFVGGPGSLCRPQTFHRSPCSSGRLDRPAVRSLQSRGHVGGIGCSVTPESDTGTTSEEEEADDRPPLPDDPEIIEASGRTVLVVIDMSVANCCLDVRSFCPSTFSLFRSDPPCCTLSYVLLVSCTSLFAGSTAG